MKKLILSAVAVMSMAGAVQAAETISESLTNGKFSVDARVYYFDRRFDKTGTMNATSLTAGGIMKYVSDDYMGFNAGFAYYSSNSIGGVYDKSEGTGSSNLQSNGDNINLLGQAYLEYKVAKTIIKVGRQALSTPVMNGYDARTVPTAYEAVVVINKDLLDTTIELDYVWASTGFGSKNNDFLDNESSWGESGLASISVINNSYEPLKVRAQYVQAVSDTYDANGTTAGQDQDITVTNYRYADINYAIPFGEKTYLKAQYGGNSYKASGADDSMMVGVKVGTTVSIVDLALLFNQIQDNDFKEVRSGVMYSAWQIGYDDKEPSTAFGVQVILKPMAGLSLKAGYVDVSSDETLKKDDFTEANFDGKYALNSISNIRVRYSVRNVSSAAKDDTGVNDRTDFRIIYGVKF
ncbi:OprD family outer membrane porin [Sulfurimonas sp.]|uniref:OprD family outer membrane porin n=1 Tax=Sulfurimonas sp. TaxID=2022749 RepID=UPI0025DB64AB|nr:OprD family outer membrane porin [Sulfurimonas sp.]